MKTNIFLEAIKKRAPYMIARMKLHQKQCDLIKSQKLKDKK